MSTKAFMIIEEIIDEPAQKSCENIFIRIFGKELGRSLFCEFSTLPEWKDSYQTMLKSQIEHKKNMVRLHLSDRKPIAYEITVTLIVAWGPGVGKKLPPEFVARRKTLWGAKLALWWYETMDQRFPREYKMTPIFKSDKVSEWLEKQ